MMSWIGLQCRLWFFMIILTYFFCNHLAREEKACCFTSIVILMSCHFYCSVTLPHDVVDWSAVLIVVFPGQAYLLVCNHLAREEKAGCFTSIVILMSCHCYCSLTLPHDVMGWSAVWIVVFPGQAYLLLCNHLAREEKAGCFTSIVILMSCHCYCSLTLPHDVMGWSAVWIVVFPGQAYLLLCNHLAREEKAGCFTSIVILMSCHCYCSLTLPHDVMGWSAVWIVVFPGQAYLLFCNHLAREEKAGCFTSIVILMSCHCYCSLTLPHDVMGWSAVWIVVFPGQAYLLLCNHLAREEKAGCFTSIVILMSCHFYCSVTLPHDVVGWSAVLIVVFHDHTYLLFSNHLAREEKACCFALIVFLMSCHCYCSVALPHDVAGLQCGLWFFMIILTYFFAIISLGKRKLVALLGLSS